MEKRRNFSSFPQYFQYIPNRGVKLHKQLLCVVVRFIFYLNSAKLICRDTDISKYFRESLGIRDNESWLYFSLNLCNNYRSLRPIVHLSDTKDMPWVQYKVDWEVLVTDIGLGGCAVQLETRRSRAQPPPRSATFFREDWSWNIFYGHSLPSADSRRAVVSF